MLSSPSDRPAVTRGTRAFVALAVLLTFSALVALRAVLGLRNDWWSFLVLVAFALTWINRLLRITLLPDDDETS